MKVLGISGSIVGSKTRIAVENILNRINEEYEDIEIELIDLKQYNLVFSDGRDYRYYAERHGGTRGGGLHVPGTRPHVLGLTRAVLRGKPRRMPSRGAHGGSHRRRVHRVCAACVRGAVAALRLPCRRRVPRGVGMGRARSAPARAVRAGGAGGVPRGRRACAHPRVKCAPRRRTARP